MHHLYATALVRARMDELAAERDLSTASPRLRHPRPRRRFGLRTRPTGARSIT